MALENSTNTVDPARRCADPARSKVWIMRIVRAIVGGLAGAFIGLFCGALGFQLGPWSEADWPEGFALYAGGPLLGAVAGSTAGVLRKVPLGAAVGAASVMLILLLVVICTVVDLDQAVGVGLVLLICGSLGGAGGGAVGSAMVFRRPSQPPSD